MSLDIDQNFLDQAIELAKQSVNNGGGPFGAIVVKNKKIIGKGNNQVTQANDPTAHAEVIAIREACKTINHFDLSDCTIYTSCEPCPMCFSAIHWANIMISKWILAFNESSSETPRIEGCVQAMVRHFGYNELTHQ